MELYVLELYVLTDLAILTTNFIWRQPDNIDYRLAITDTNKLSSSFNIGQKIENKSIYIVVFGSVCYLNRNIAS